MPWDDSGVSNAVSSTLNTLSTVMDFLGGGLGGDAVSGALSYAADRSQAASAGTEIYDNALGQCVTEGQIALMEQVGPDAFEEAIRFGLDNEGEVGGFLVDLTDHPEAIGEILEQAEEEIAQLVETMLNDDGIQIAEPGS